MVVRQEAGRQYIKSEEELSPSLPRGTTWDQLWADGFERRRTIAGCFFELLVLKTHTVIDLKQSEPYGDIEVSRGKEWSDDPTLMENIPKEARQPTKEEREAEERKDLASAAAGKIKGGGAVGTSWTRGRRVELEFPGLERVCS